MVYSRNHVAAVGVKGLRLRLIRFLILTYLQGGEQRKKVSGRPTPARRRKELRACLMLLMTSKIMLTELCALPRLSACDCEDFVVIM